MAKVIIQCQCGEKYIFNEPTLMNGRTHLADKCYKCKTADDET